MLLHWGGGRDHLDRPDHVRLGLTVERAGLVKHASDAGDQSTNDGATDASVPSLTMSVTNTQSSSWTVESTTKISVEANVGMNVRVVEL